MIDLMGAAAMGAFARYKVKSDYKKGCGEESIKAATMVYGMNAMRRGSAGTLALGGLLGVNSAINSIEREEKRKQIVSSAYRVDDGIDITFYGSNDNTYAWRLNCEDGSEYGIFPEDYETRDEYNAALRFAKAGDETLDVEPEETDVFDVPIEPDEVELMTEYLFCRVSRLDNGTNEYYLAGDAECKIGEIVLVPDESGNPVHAVVLSVEHHTALTAPQKLEETRTIIRKV